MTDGDENRRVAVLIDGDNFPAELADRLFSKIRLLGNAAIRRVYGAAPAMANWRDHARQHGVALREGMPGKNATDMHLAIDAMDILHRGRIAAFCIVSSDQDFAALANRLREDVVVHGFGGSQATAAFRDACDTFVVLEKSAMARPSPAPQSTVPKSQNVPRALQQLLEQAIARLGPDTTQVTLGVLGYQVKQLDRDFSAKRYGFKNLKTLVMQSHLELSPTGTVLVPPPSRSAA